MVFKKFAGWSKGQTTFNLTSASTALGGTIFSSLQGQGLQTTGKILPSVGVALVPGYAPLESEYMMERIKSDKGETFQRCIL